MSSINPSGMDLWLLWAKWSPRSRSPQTYHPLLCHLVDVAVVTEVMWREVLPPWARRRFAAAFGLGEGVTGRWLAFWTGLHDIGKASPAFQLQIKPGQGLELVRDRLRAAGLPCPPPGGKAPHGMISTQVLRDLLPDTFSLDRDLAERIATAVGGHHGTFPTSGDVRDLSKDAVGRGGWPGVRAELVRQLATVVEVPAATLPGRLDHATAMALAGFVSVADWIGSNEDYFPHAARDANAVPTLDLSTYAAQARAHGHAALRRLGWLGWTPPGEARPFTALFPDIAEPRPVQKEAAALAERLVGPGLVVVEVPMGEGKTEAAMYLADRWGVALGQRGCYFALPTQATSDQMFGRVRRFLAGRYPDDLVNVQLLHGHAALSAEFAELREHGDKLFALQQVYDMPSSDGSPAAVVAAEWFTGRKRGLLAPFGVGTVDQALLAVLQTRHVFVRLFGLAAKTVIIDEVHAYDTYMTTLLARLLEWLSALGTSVVLLSATLPQGRRDELVRAYAKGAGWMLTEPPVEASYPRVTWALGGTTGARQVATSAQATRELALAWVDGRLPAKEGAPFALGERLQDALAGGGCAAMICNTVARAQQVYRALKPYFPNLTDDGEPELDLLHARFLYEGRERREKRVVRRFGKDARTADETSADDETAPRRPLRAVLVATQIIEQSLDLDFDLMVSDHAPADLLLQRAGRLHRHDRSRPAGLGEPQLWICEPESLADGVPGFGRGTEAVYDAHVLFRSWLALRGRPIIAIPGDVEVLIEAVYDDRACPPELEAALRQRWEETQQGHDATVEDERAQAEQRYIKPPSFEGLLWRLTGEPREEDAPELHPAHQALTRLIEVTVPVICLRGTPERPVLPGDDTPIDLKTTPDVALAKRLLGRSVTVTDRRVAYTLLEQETPAGWRTSPLLRHHRLVALDSANGVMVGRFRLQLDDEVGLIIVDTQDTQAGSGNDRNTEL